MIVCRPAENRVRDEPGDDGRGGAGAPRTGRGRAGIHLAVISSDNLVPASQAAHLLGWERHQDDGAVASSSFGLVNLSYEAPSAVPPCLL